MLKRYRAAVIAAVALCVSSTIMFAAGSWSTLPVIGFSSYCAATVSGAGGFNAQGNVGGGGITGQGQASSGSLCAQTVPAGPSIVTGNEVIPADLNNPSNITPTQGTTSPTTALVSMASLNALPIYTFTAATASLNTLVASPTAGGYNFNATGTISSVTITLPSAPVDGQQFAIASNQTITTLTLTTVTGAPGGTAAPTIKQNPTVLTVSTTASYNYRLIYSAIYNAWSRLQ